MTKPKKTIELTMNEANKEAVQEVSEKNIKKSIDKDFVSNNFNAIARDVKKDTESSVKSKKASPSNPESSDNDEYTIDPITGAKYLKPKGDSYLSFEVKGIIPELEKEGYVFCWPVNYNDAVFHGMVAQGWEYAYPENTGCKDAKPIALTSSRKDGKQLFHVPMFIPMAKYVALNEKQEQLRQQKENDTIFNPGATLENSKYVKAYTTTDHRAPEISRQNREMDIDMAQKFDKAMR